MKIKQVCETTGLSERTIRFYIEKKLISPSCYEMNGRIYHDYSKEDVVKLSEVALLRKIGFSINSITAMQTNPEMIDELLKAHCIALGESLQADSYALNALNKTAGLHYESISDLYQTLVEDANALKLPQSDITPNFAKFDDETLQEREKLYMDFLLHQKKKAKRAHLLKPVKKAGLFLCLTAVIAGMIFGIIYGISRIPSRIKREFAGVELLMGKEASAILETVDITIDGWLYDPLFSEPYFKGVFELSAYPFTSETAIKIPFMRSDNKAGYMIYSLIETDGTKSVPRNESFGVLYTDKEFKSVAIHLFDMVKNEYGDSGSTGNRVIAAPAENVYQAQELLFRHGLYWIENYTGIIYQR